MINQYRELFSGEVGGSLTWAGRLPITLVSTPYALTAYFKLISSHQPNDRSQPCSRCLIGRDAAPLRTAKVLAGFGDDWTHS
jgi:hypothetical protein